MKFSVEKKFMENRTETEEKQIKLKWFNALPREKMRHEPCEYESTCPCGKTVWYEGGVLTLDLESWIEIHYEHRNGKFAAPKVKAKLTIEARYDFTRRIGFSKAGFALFVEELRLVKDKTIDDNAIFVDRERRRFAFFEAHTYTPIKDEYEGIYVIFNPAMSRLEADGK